MIVANVERHQIGAKGERPGIGLARFRQDVGETTGGRRLSRLALVARRRYPVAVLAVVFAATVGYFVAGYPNGPIWLALIIAYYTATADGHRLAAGIAAVAGFAIFPWLDYLLRGRPAQASRPRLLQPQSRYFA